MHENPQSIDELGIICRTWQSSKPRWKHVKRIKQESQTSLFEIWMKI